MPDSMVERSETPERGAGEGVGKPSTTALPGHGQRDVGLLYLARTLRSWGGGALAVALALDLAVTYSNVLAGVFLAVSMIAASVWSIAAERIERAIGRKKTFAVSALAWALGGFLLFQGVSSVYAVVLALLLGGILASASDVGPLPTLEQATLGSVVEDARRTRSFSYYNLLGYLGSAAGALTAVPLTDFGRAFLPAPADLVLFVYGVVGLALIPTYFLLSPLADRVPERTGRRALSPESRPKILALSALFSVDAFGGGLVANFLVTLWLRARFSASGEVIGVILALAMGGAALSLLLAVPLARRFGLVNTMVFTHIPSSVILLLFAFAPTLGIAGGLWVGRSLLSQMDVPTRQSLVQGIVSPEERTAAAGYTTAARTTSAAGGPITGEFVALGGPWFAAPFVLASSTKIAYDLALFAAFRKVRTPEERRAR